MEAATKLRCHRCTVSLQSDMHTELDIVCLQPVQCAHNENYRRRFVLFMLPVTEHTHTRTHPHTHKGDFSLTCIKIMMSEAFFHEPASRTNSSNCSFSNHNEGLQQGLQLQNAMIVSVTKDDYNLSKDATRPPFAAFMCVLTEVKMRMNQESLEI